MLWAILIVVAAVGFYVLHRLLFLETAPVVPQSKLGLEKTKVGTKKPKAEKKNDKAGTKVAKKDTHFDKYTKDKDSDDEDVKETPKELASPSSPAKTQFATPVSKKAQNKALREGFVTIEKKARNQPTAEEKEKRDALRKEEEEELKKKEEARKIRQKERAEKEALEKEKKKEENNEQSVKDFLEKQKKEKEAQKLARSGSNKGGVVKVFSAAEQANKKWEASPTVYVGEGSTEVDEDSFPQLGK